MDKGDDPWEIVGVPRDATESDIKKAFRKGALKYHPDKQTTEEDRAAAHDIFAKLSAAYETLNDPVKRYDWRQAEEARVAKSSSRTSQQKRTSAPVPAKKAYAAPAPTQKRPSSAVPTQKRPSGTAPTQKSPSGTAPTQKRPSGTVPTQKRPSAGKVPPPSSSPASKGPSKSSKSPPPPSRTSKIAPSGSTRKSSAGPSSSPAMSPKRHSVPEVPGKPVKKNPAQKRVSAPASSMAWERQGPKSGSKPTVKMYRDPFDIFDNVMKEEYGKDYKDKDESGWKGSIGVPGLAKINPFKKKSESSAKEFKKLDVNNDKALSKGELGKYIESHSDLWSTLGMNLNLPVKKCIEVATEVAFSLAFGEGKNKPKNNEHRKRHELSESEFRYFHKHYVLDEKGSHEFFLRTIFSVFDLNNDGVLNAKELDRFLDIFYKAKDVFKGDMKLPEKKHLLKIVGKRLDSNRDGVLQFDEIRDLLEVAAVVTTDK